MKELLLDYYHITLCIGGIFLWMFGKMFIQLGIAMHEGGEKTVLRHMEESR